MRRLVAGAVVTAILLVIVATILIVPPQSTDLQKLAVVFLGVLTGVAAIAEIVGLVNHFKPVDDNAQTGDEITTRGNYSPGKVGKNYILRQSKTHRRKPLSSHAQQETNATTNATDDRAPGARIQTEGNYSPGMVEEDYEVDNG